ncbi:MAG: hypothetical protein AAGI23_16385 [Bacteroidota bacterium]
MKKLTRKEKERRSQPVVARSKPYNAYKWWLIGAVIFFGAGATAILSSDFIVVEEYINLNAILGLALFVALGMLSLYALIERKQYGLTKEKIVVNSRIFSSKTYDDIKGYTEEEYDGKYVSGKRLVFKTANGFVRINSNTCLNYPQIRSFAKRNFSEDDRALFVWHRFRRDLLLLLVLLGLTVFFGWLSFKVQAVESEQAVMTFQSRLATPPIIKSTGGKDDEQYVRLKVERYPEILFEIKGKRYRALDQSLLSKLDVDQSVRLTVDEKEFRNKIEKLNNPPWGIKFLHWRKMSVLQMEAVGKSYIDQEHIAQFDQENREDKWLFLALALCFGGVFIFCVRSIFR